MSSRPEMTKRSRTNNSSLAIMPTPPSFVLTGSTFLTLCSFPSLVSAQCDSTTASPNAISTPAPTLPLVSPVSVDVTVLVIGIVILLGLFGASFYFVVVWPRRALMEYRRRFEVLIQEDQVHADLKQLRLEENSPLYGGATKAANSKRIPTMREIEMAAMTKATEEGGGGGGGGGQGLQGGAVPLSPPTSPLL